uniref:Uncharacterized protein LOC111118853 n=1 Tax=Crassostrea virginica TaxID=6565 RepID=A0A8B8CEP2_CRAVI|nr:uncharacterized protein LOC111118853 [Crassostrea virginica]
MKGPVMRVEDGPVDEDNLELDTVVLPGGNNRRLPTPVTVRGFLVNQEKPGPSCPPENSDPGGTEEEEVPIIQVDSGEESSTDNSDENADLLNNERDNEDLDEGFDDPTFSENRVIEFDPQTVRFKYSRMSTLPEPETTPPTVVDGDIGTLRNIRVIANRDYKAHNCNELNLKKGQVIKQKIGENEEGYAYGWTREGKLSPKHYGWYPISVVSYR